jgi:uncharacterized Zn-binding protein involved in type VI secretion
VPYNNSLMASDLAKGSKTVKIQGNPTALEDASEISTSMGNEAATQGGGVITHKTKGKGFFTLWSFDVKVEGKGVDRHGDPMGQNAGTPPWNGLDAQAQVQKGKAEKAKTKCTKKFGKKDRYGTPTTAQKDAVNDGRPCWECESPSPRGWTKAPPPKPGVAKQPKGRRFVADHQPPCLIMFYAGGCQSAADQEQRVKNTKSVKPHCSQCSSRQGGFMSAVSKKLASAHGV